MKKAIFILVILILIFPCNAEVITVDDDGPADFVHIQDAINYSWNGDIIEVHPGTYPENIYYDSRAILLTGIDPNDPNIIESTIIQGAVTFNFNEGPDSILTGFTVAPVSGDGVVCYGSYTMPIIEKNIISGCSTAVCCAFGAGPYILDNTISNNSYGIQNCQGRIEGNSIRLNGQYGIDNCTGVVFENDIIDNDKGIMNVTGDITGNTITGNSSYGIYHVTGDITDNVITGNGSYSIYWVDGNITNNTITGNGSGIVGVSGDITENIITGNVTGIAQINGKVINNTISNNQGYGIVSCTGDIISNHITFNQGDGLYECNYWNEGFIIYQNDISNNTGNGLYKCRGIIYKNTINTNSGNGLRYCGTDIRDNTISGNTGDGISECEGSIIHNTITENYRGIYRIYTTPDNSIVNNFISNNQNDGICDMPGPYLGYGLQVNNNTIINNGGNGVIGNLRETTVKNNLIAGNKLGGVENCTDVINNTIVENLGDGVHECQGIVKNNILAYNTGKGIYGPAQNSYNCFWLNTAGSFYNNYAKAGDQYMNPLFAVLGSWSVDVWTKGDYTLLSEYGRWDDVSKTWINDTQTSPCINAGDPADEIIYEPNPNGGRINMGYDGGTEHASMSDLDGPPPVDPPVIPAVCVNRPSMDTNNDCKIDMIDYAVFASQWLMCGLDKQSACWE